ncbi:MAG: VRR-NUC domain-containing protein [Pseudomonadota bacterium]
MSWNPKAKNGRRRTLTASGAPRKRPFDYEGMEQRKLISWLRGEYMRGSQVGRLFPHVYHPPNGGVRSWKTAKALKDQGARAGVSDLVVRQARGGWHGLYLELKATPPRDAELADSQQEWLTGSDEQGYCAALGLGVEQAKAVLREYASWPRTCVEGTPLVLEAGSEWRRESSDGEGRIGDGK